MEKRWTFTWRDRLRYMLQALFTPACWVQNYRYCRYWDRELIWLMRNHRFFVLDGDAFRSNDSVYLFAVRIGARRLWIANYPYCAFMPCDESGIAHNYRPSRAVVLAAADKVRADTGYSIQPISKKVVNAVSGYRLSEANKSPQERDRRGV